VRLSTAGTSVNVESNSATTGDFSVLMLDINSTLTSTGYPTNWTKYAVTVTGLSAATMGKMHLGIMYLKVAR